jgi:YegS/Rv2252/BmrU family lipid kinase
MKALLIFNPAAGWRDVRRELKKVTAYLEEKGWRISFRETFGRGDATTFAREAVAKGYDVVIVAGGDGTISEACDGLAGSRVALGVLPIGVGNVWALEMGIPTPSRFRRHHLLEAAKILVEGKIRRIDLGRAGRRHFILWAGIGLDAIVTKKIESMTKAEKRMGALAYIVAGILVAKDFAGTKAIVKVDGRNLKTRAMLILVGNAQLYGGVVRITREAKIDDGLLDVCVLKGYGLPSAIHHAMGVFTGRHLRDPQVDYLRGKKVSVHTAKPMPVQVDGDPIGTTPMEFEVLHKALSVIVPKEVPKGLFLES